VQGAPSLPKLKGLRTCREGHSLHLPGKNENVDSQDGDKRNSDEQRGDAQKFDTQICDALMDNMGNSFFENLVAPRKLDLVSQPISTTTNQANDIQDAEEMETRSLRTSEASFLPSLPLIPTYMVTLPPNVPAVYFLFFSGVGLTS
jgi:hypothetical protein